MGYEIKLPEVIALRNAVLTADTAYANELGNVCSVISSLIESEGFQGKTADSVSLYVSEVHGAIGMALDQAMSELRDRLMVYETGFSNIDGSDEAHITQDALENVQVRINGNMESFAGQISSLVTVLNSISDIYVASVPGTESVSSRYDASRMIASQLNESAGTYEASHLGDCANINGILDNVMSIIQFQDKGIISVSSYTTGKIAELDAYRSLGNAYNASVQYYSDNMQQITSAHDSISAKIEAEIEAAEKAAAEERARKGFWDAVAAVGTMAIGAAAIICTGGAATPLVVAAGVSAIAYGASNMVEAGQDIYYGLNGDARTKSINVIRDTVFNGNQTLYDIWGTASTAMSLGFVFAGSAAQAAVSAGEANPLTAWNMAKSFGAGAKTFATGGVKNAVVTIAKVGLVGETGNIVNKVVAPYTSEDFGRLSGMLAASMVASKVFGSSESQQEKNTKKSGVGSSAEDSKFTGKLRGEDVTLEDVTVKDITYEKRSPSELKAMRDEFNSTTRKSFLEELGKNPEQLRAAGFSEKDILKIQHGRVPDGWQVHHKVPLDDSGTNTNDNLVLIQNEPYHKVLTNYQNGIARQMGIGDTQVVKWPMPNGSIYPAHH